MFSNGWARVEAVTRALRLRGVLLAWALLGAACASITSATPNALPPGATEPDVLAVMGKPTGSYNFTDGGKRLEFARGPQGRETWMIDFDASGKMVDAEQVMDLWYLTRIEPGMTVDQVLIRVGHPGNIRPIPRQQLSVWNYRYPTNDCLWYQISVGDDGRVLTGSTGIDPQCDPGSRYSGGGVR
jgi:hypothetical protein